MTATTNTHALPKGNIRASINRFFAGLGQGFNAYLEAKSRTAEIERLNIKSDEDLAKLGIKRDEIPRYVFRDLLFL